MAMNERDLLKIKKLLTEVNALRKEFGKTAYEIKDATAITDEQVKSIRQEYQYLSEISGELSDSWEGIGGIIRDIKREFQGQNNLVKEGLSSYKKLQGIAEKFKHDMLGISKMDKKQIEQNITGIRKEFAVRQNIIRALELKSQTSEGLLDTEKKMLGEMKEGLDVYNEALHIAEGRLDAEKRINKAMGLTGLALKSINGASRRLGIDLGDIFEDAQKASREMAENLTDGGKKSAGFFGKMRIAAKGAGTAMKGLFSKMKDPVFIIGGIISGLKALYKIQGRVMKQNASMMAATEGAFGGGTARGMESMLGLSEDISRRVGDINTALGFNLQSNLGEANRGMQIMTDYFGLSAKESANLFALSSQTGVNFSQMATEVASSAGSFQGMTGYAVQTGKVMRTIANSSATARFNFQGSKEQMMQAGYYASLLGMSMDEVNSAARTTLNFEDSIAAEIEAELLLNKDLNLEKLRYAALTGDSATQAAELHRLVEENYGSLKGNVLAQEAFSKATGVSMEHVAQSVENMKLSKEFGTDSVKVQKALNYLMGKGLSKEEAMAKIKEKGVKSQIAAQDADIAHQKRWELVVRKFQDAFIPLANKLFGENGENINNFANKAIKVAKVLSDIMVKFVDYAKEIGLVIAAMAGFKIGKAIYDAFFQRGSAANPMFVVPMGGMGGMGPAGPGGVMPMGGPDGGGGPQNKNKKNQSRKQRKNSNKRNNKRSKPRSNSRGRTRTRSRGRGMGGLLMMGGAMFGYNALFGGSDETPPDVDISGAGGGGGGGSLDGGGGDGEGANWRVGAGAMDYGDSAGTFTIGGKENLSSLSNDVSTSATPPSSGPSSSSSPSSTPSSNTSSNADQRADFKETGFNHGGLGKENYAIMAGMDLAGSAVEGVGNTKLAQKAKASVLSPFQKMKGWFAKTPMVKGVMSIADKGKEILSKGGDMIKESKYGKQVSSFVNQAKGKVGDMKSWVGDKTEWLKGGQGKKWLQGQLSKFQEAAKKAPGASKSLWAKYVADPVSSAYKQTKGAVTSGSKYLYDQGSKAITWTKNTAIAPVTDWFKKNMGGMPKKMMGSKVFRGIFKKIPIVGMLLEGVFANMDIKDALANGAMTMPEVEQGIGKKVFEAIGGLVGGAIAATVVAAPQVVGIPSWLLSPLAYVGGDFIGRHLGGWMADLVGAKPIGKLLYNQFYKESPQNIISDKEASTLDASNKNSKIKVDDFVIETHKKDQVAIGGTNLTGNLEKKLDELIGVIKANNGTVVNLDGIKVSEVLRNATTNLG